MEFHIPKNSDSQCFQQSFDFSPQELADIPCPDDICTQRGGSPEEDDELLLPPGTSIDDFPDLPLPPGTSGEDFPIPLPPMQKPFSVSNNFSPSLPPNKAFESTSNLLHVESENFNILPLDEDSQQKSDIKIDDFQEDMSVKHAEFLDDSKYSPSKVDSDEDNQDFTTAKPKVLGKEQAKKRLLAFSLSKQPTPSVKKQSKTIMPAKNKEKPPNPNKGSNVQEQFRATISAIEEEKKKMFQNMPSYLLLEMSELAKSSHSSMSLSVQILEKLKNENADSKSKDNLGKDGSSSNKSNEGKGKKSFRKSRSRSKSKRLRRSRSKRRSRSRTKRSHSRSGRRSYSRSHRRSRDKNSKMDKNSQPLSKKKLFENWSSFKAAGSILESESSKNRSDDLKSRRDEHLKRSRSPNDRPEFKPIFNYLNKGYNLMTSFQAKPVDHGSSSAVFLEKTIKYTRTKPILCWAENPARATEFYMSKQMLLENCDETTASLLLCIMESKKLTPLEDGDISECISTKTRPWYPQEDHLLPARSKSVLASEKEALTKAVEADDFLVEGPTKGKEESSTGHEDAKKERVPLERKISLVNDSYLSEEEEQVKEVTVGELKVRLDLDMNRVKVRSRWDSDYEGENSEKDIIHHKKAKRDTTSSKIQIEGLTSQAKDILMDDFDVAPCQEIDHDSMEKKKFTSLNFSNVKIPQPDSLNLDACDGTAGNLVSEYEEFLKMVSVDSSDNHNSQKEKVALESKPKAEKPKVKKNEKSNEDHEKVQGSKLGATDWDQDSDHEEKSISKKMQFAGTGPHDEFLILSKTETTDVTLEKSKKKASKKKNEKQKSKKKKIFKKSSKAKKGKFEDSFTEDDSSSESYESDSDSDSVESRSSKKNKKRKGSKTKKKSRKDSSSESNTDSDSSKTRKKKQSKKKAKKRKSSSSDEKEEVQTTMLKQLDFKKQLIIKKIDEMDSISDKGSKRKEKENRGRKKEKESLEETDLDKYIKSGKKKKVEGKLEKDKKKSKYAVKKGKLTGKSKKLKKSKSSSESDSETDSDSDSTDDSVKKKKSKKAGKRKRYTSDSSDSEEKPSKHKSKSSSKIFKKAKKSKRNSSSSDSDDSDYSSGDKKIKKKGKKVKSDDEKLERITELSFKENLLIDEPAVKSEERSDWEGRKWKKSEGKIKKDKEDDDWEASSSVEESEQERRTMESSWDEEVPKTAALVPENSSQKTDKRKTPVMGEKEISVYNSTDTSDANNQLTSETLKTSLSNFSFNENSFCSFGQELSRDFFLAERSYSNSGNICNSESFKTSLIEPRPFQSVSRDAGAKKPADSELYSPGYSDSDLSEAEMSKSEKANSNSNAESRVRGEVYDPLNCDSEASVDNNEVEVSSIPLPHVPDILLPGEGKGFENVGLTSSSNSDGSAMKDLPRNEMDIAGGKLPCMTPPIKSCFTSSDFTPVAASQSPLTEEKNTPTKRQVMSVKGQQKLISKAASVFQDESDEENVEPVTNKEKTSENTQYEVSGSSKDKSTDEIKSKKEEKHSYRDEKEKDHGKKRKKETRDRSRERSSEREGRRRRSRSRESRESGKVYNKKSSSPRKRKSKTPEVSREKREIRSDSFEIEPLKSSLDANELTEMIQPIPVLTGLDTSSEGLWSRSIVPGCEFPHTTDNLIDHAESFDIYPSEESNFRHKNYDKDYAELDRSSGDKSRDQKNKKERRKSRSRSYSPRKKLRSKSPERRKSPRSRSPRRKSASPKRREKSPFSPRRRSPKRKSPSRKHKISRSPDKRRKSSSRSPRKRRGSPSRRSRSASPRKYRSPKHREESPRRKESPSRAFGSRDRFSPRADPPYNQPYPDGLHNRIPVIGASSEDIDMSSTSPSKFEGRMGFPRHLPNSSVTEAEMYGSFYDGEYPEEFGVRSYPEDVGVNNLITVKNHDIERRNSPERLSLDQRIELELGVQMSNSQAQSEQFQMSNQVCPPFQEINQSHFPNSYNCENSNLSNDNFYHNQNLQMNTDFNGQYFNGHQQQATPTYGPFQQYPNSQSAQNSVLQVGNIVEVVPTLQHPPPLPPIPPKTPQIMQVGNVLQVVPSQKASASVPSSVSLNYGPPDASPMVKTQKATAVVAPSSVVPTPSPEAVLNPLIKAIQLEREKRRKEKEKRKAEREARRKARQLRREAKLLSVNEKLKKSVQNEGLMLGQEVEDDELLEGLDVPSPPIPVEIITVSSISALPPAGKGILITAGFMPKPPSEKKEVKFADGVCPGEGTSTSGGEDIASPPPKPKLPKEKRFKKKKTKVKKKVKVQIIRQIIQEDDDEDDLSPPPPPPGDPPLVFFAKFPFAGDAQFPVYQTQTTTTTLTTVQYPAQTFE